MNLNEVTHLLAVLGPILGVVSAILTGALWLVRRHVSKLDEEIEDLKQEKKSLEGDLKNAQADAKQFQVDRDEAIRRKDEADRSVTPLLQEVSNLRLQVKTQGTEGADNKAIAEKYKADAEKYLAAGQAEYKKRKEAEARAEKAESEVKNAEARLAKIESDSKLALETAKKRTETIELSLTTAIKLRNEADTKKASLQKERDSLSETVIRLEKQIESVVKQDGRVWNVPLGSNIPPFVPLVERRTPIISILNLKGGVGKTTITANLAGYLGAELGKRVLMIDLDHQRSLTQLLLTADNRKAAALARRTVQDFLIGKRTGTDLHAVTEKVPGLETCSVVTNSDPESAGFGATKNLDDIEMSLLSRWLVNPTEDDVRFLMRPALQSNTISEAFDYVLIDCPPRLTTACINALVASDFILIPTQAEAIAIRSVPHLLTRLKILREAGVLSHLQVLGIVANMVSSNAQEKTSPEAKLLREFEALAEGTWGKPVKAFKNKLKDSAYYASATKKLEDCQRLNLAVENKPIREQYEPLFKEIEGRINESIGVAGVPA